MTAAKTIPNIILDSGGSNELTVYTTSAEKIYNKTLTKVTAPQSSANWASGPKDTKIVDLLRIETRYAVKGYIDSADETKLETLFNQGGVFNMTFKSSTFEINIEKLSIVDNNSNEQDETDIMFTAIVGVNL